MSIKTQIQKAINTQRRITLLAKNLRTVQSATGTFREKEYGNYFNYRRVSPDTWAASIGASHEFYTDTGDFWIGVRLGKTVAYVVIDEDREGQAYWEKWNIIHVHGETG